MLIRIILAYTALNLSLTQLWAIIDQSQRCTCFPFCLMEMYIFQYSFIIAGHIAYSKHSTVIRKVNVFREKLK